MRLFAVILALAAAGCAGDPEAEPATGSTGGKSDTVGDGDPASGVPTLRFARGFPDLLPTGTLIAGGKVRLEYERDRMYDVVDWSQAGGIYFESAHHCYGYGCCEVRFDDIAAHVRFGASGPFQVLALDDGGAVEVHLPASAARLEVYFDTPGYDIKTWYCGCDQACSDQNHDSASFQSIDHDAWDSQFGQNYVFAVAPEPSAEIEFGHITAAPVVSGSIRAGHPLRIRFDRNRFYDVIDHSAGSGSYFDSAHHCYGYGCCEVELPEVAVHARFRDGGSWQSIEISDQDDAVFDLPASATRVELYFDVPGYDIKTWYCGCDQACSDQNHDSASFKFIDRDAWDSRYGQNYSFTVAP